MKESIKNKIAAELMKSLKTAKITKRMREKNEISLSDKKIREVFNLLNCLPTFEVDDIVIIPVGRLINLYSIESEPELNYFYFLVLRDEKTDLHISDLKVNKRISEIIGCPRFPKEEKDNKLVFLISCFQNHPDFIFEDIERMNELLT